MKQIARSVLLSIVAIMTMALSLAMVSAESPNYDIIQVEVNDLEVLDNVLDVERDEDLEVEVYVEGDANISGSFVDKVRVEAEIIGYEFGPISDVTEVFSVEAGVVHKKLLHLHIPDDIDASEKYTLRIRVSDQVDEEELLIALNVDEQRHALNIFDIIISPTNVMAGKPVFGKIRVENLGEKEENDVKVMISIPQLGVSESGFIPELVTQLEEEDEEFFEQQSSDQIEFILRIPEDAPSGEYTVQVDVVYNRGHSQVSESRRITVQAIPQGKVMETVINPETTSKTAKVGEQVQYRVMIANLGDEKGVYSVQLDGTQWAEAYVEPGFLTVMPDSTGQFTIFLRPLEGADARMYTFNARVMLGNEVVSDVILQTKVEEAAEEKAASATTFKTVLAIIFAILVVVLIVLGIIIAVRRAEEDDESPGAVEGQTYYYSPKR